MLLKILLLNLDSSCFQKINIEFFDSVAFILIVKIFSFSIFVKKD